MKMETPKMDVVRFQEADVIVASTPATPVTLFGFSDQYGTNGRISFSHGGTDYLFETKDYESQASFADAVKNAGVADVIFNDSHNPDNNSLSGMYYADVELNGKSLLLPDGEYNWDSSTHTYRYHQ